MEHTQRMAIGAVSPHAFASSATVESLRFETTARVIARLMRISSYNHE
jgi:hypothetical protein